MSNSNPIKMFALKNFAIFAILSFIQCELSHLCAPKKLYLKSTNQVVIITDCYHPYCKGFSPGSFQNCWAPLVKLGFVVFGSRQLAIQGKSYKSVHTLRNLVIYFVFNCNCGMFAVVR